MALLKKPASNRIVIDLLPEISSRAALLGLKLGDSELEPLATFLQLLIAYNEHTNLVASADIEVLVYDHVLDSLSVWPLVSQYGDGKSPVRLADLGSGAGFPGLLLAIIDKNVRACLIESVGKKAHFLESVVQELALQERVSVYCERAEVLGRHDDLRAGFDLATARAVGTFDVVAELTFPLLSVGGHLLCQKSSKQLDEEKVRAAIALPILNGHLIDVVAVDKNIVDKDVVVMVAKKFGPTSSKYPRNPQQIKKQPLGVK